MSDDEILVFITSIAIAAWGWYKWYAALGKFNSLNRKRPGLFWLSIIPLIAWGGIFYVLKTMASFDVREDIGYLWFYIIFGAAWIVAGRGIFFYLFDISWRDDAVERQNPAAVYTISCGIIGLAAFYAGANIGDGPGWWCVLFAGGLAAVVWFGLMMILEKSCEISEKITIERDLPTGIRTGYYLIASGIICGRGAAGDWSSALKTVIEFKDAWPVLLLTIIAILVQQVSPRDNPAKPIEALSFTAHIWGLFYIVLAIIAVLLVPPLPENPYYGLVIPLGLGLNR
ncbi:MAG: hypothetical protein GXY86_04175 [Firmicutes bacterium]|nr:hypothetical protein [Bacillota bacterium]